MSTSNTSLPGRTIYLLLLVALVISGCGSGSDTSLPPIGPPRLETVVTGLTSPVFVTHAGDGSNRLFIVEQPGRIQVLPKGNSTPSVYLDIASKVLHAGERGLLGLAFHPQFRTNGRFFVNYTRQSDGATVIAEYHQSSTNRDVASFNETILLTIPQPYENHNGGMLAFGSDGFLYIGMGDGGSANDPQNRAQNTKELLGKILRIDVDHQNGSTPYSIPRDNPFADGVGGRAEIFALGLRNPWRFSFDRSTGKLYVGDVGQNAREEVDIITRGGNYGWRIQEGTVCTGIDPTECAQSTLLPPVVDYDHNNGRCAVTGGYVYRGGKRTLEQGSYLYGDFCSGEVFQWENGTQRVLLDTDLPLASFGEDETGELYAVGLDGRLLRFVAGT